MANRNLDTVLAYYDAINNNQPDLAAEKLAENVCITTPLDSKTGKTDVVNALRGFCSAVEQVTICDKFVNESQVMLTYNIQFPEPIGNLRAAGLLQLEKHQITRIELFYDGRVMEAKKDEIFSNKSLGSSNE